MALGDLKSQINETSWNVNIPKKITSSASQPKLSDRKSSVVAALVPIPERETITKSGAVLKISKVAIHILQSICFNRLQKSMRYILGRGRLTDVLPFCPLLYTLV